MGRKGDSGIIHSCEPMIRCPNIVFSGIGSPRFEYISFTKSVGAVFVLVENVFPIASTNRSAFSCSKCHDSWVSQLEFPKRLCLGVVLYRFDSSLAGCLKSVMGLNLSPRWPS